MSAPPRRARRILALQVHDPEREGQVEDGLRVAQVRAEKLFDAVDAIHDGVDVDEAAGGDPPLDAILVEIGAQGRDQLSAVGSIVVEERPERSPGEGGELIAGAVPEEQAIRSKLGGTDDGPTPVELEHQVNRFASQLEGRRVLVGPGAAAADADGHPVDADHRLQVADEVVDQPARFAGRPPADRRQDDDRAEMLDREAPRRPDGEPLAHMTEDPAQPIVVRLRADDSVVRPRDIEDQDVVRFAKVVAESCRPSGDGVLARI